MFTQDIRQGLHTAWQICFFLNLWLHTTGMLQLCRLRLCVFDVYTLSCTRDTAVEFLNVKVGVKKAIIFLLSRADIKVSKDALARLLNQY
jgi:hypothetical protein